MDKYLTLDGNCYSFMRPYLCASAGDIRASVRSEMASIIGVALIAFTTQ